MAERVLRLRKMRTGSPDDDLRLRNHHMPRLLQRRTTLPNPGPQILAQQDNRAHPLNLEATKLKINSHAQIMLKLQH